MRIINRSEYVLNRYIRPTIRINTKGTISFNKGSSELLKLNLEKEKILVTFDEKQKAYFIGKIPHINNDFNDVCFLARNHKSTKSKAWIFNASTLVFEIIKQMELHIVADKKGSVLLKVEENPVEWKGLKMHKIH